MDFNHYIYDLTENYCVALYIFTNNVCYPVKIKVNNKQYGCFCEYVDKLRTNMVSAYVCACQTMGIAVNKQRCYHDKDTATCIFKPGNWVLYWNKPKSLQTLYSGWTGPFVVVEKVPPVDYTIQFAPDAKKKTVHYGELQLDPCDQDRPNWVKDKLMYHQLQNTVSTDRVVPAPTLPKLPITTVILRCTGTTNIENTSSRLQGSNY